MLNDGITNDVYIPDDQSPFRPDEEYVEKLQNALKIAEDWLSNMADGVCGTPDYNSCWHDCSARGNVIAHDARRLLAKMHKEMQ